MSFVFLYFIEVSKSNCAATYQSNVQTGIDDSQETLKMSARLGVMDIHTGPTATENLEYLRTLIKGEKAFRIPASVIVDVNTENPQIDSIQD